MDQTSDEKTNHNPLLASYVKYMFTNVKGAPVFAYEQICRLYLKLLQSNVRCLPACLCLYVALAFAGS